ncbi:MAG: copper amine oxidase N-terminal domain-containing protein [Firmicutes bacterium]|nr:copper amine oxidase N-terminal domain-containing protein [Bacillota bacterium]
MKRKISILLVITLIISLIPLQVFANKDITVTLNGQNVNFDINPQMINNRVMVSMRHIFESFGMNVSYSGGKIYASDDNNRIQMEVGLKWIYKNTSNIEMDVPPRIVNNRTLVPVRAISECLGADVKWDNNSRTVIITTDKNITINNTTKEDCKYYIGVDYRSIKRQYKNAKGQFAFATSYINEDNQICILTDIWYTLTANYHDVTLHNLTTGQTIKDPESYYDKMSNYFWGIERIHYIGLCAEVLEHLVNMEKQQEGIKINSDELNKLLT